MAEDLSFDLVVIGSGPAGEKGAAQAAYFGKRVAVVEKEPEPGGAGVHTGTLPSKTLRETALYLSGHRARDLYGVAVELDPNATLPRLMARKSAIASAEAGRIRWNLDRHDVRYFHGAGKLRDAHTVVLTKDDGSEVCLDTKFVLIATGSRPRQPADIDFADDHIHDSDEILEIDKLPKSMAILGGGVIGCEYACMFAALGSRITLVDSRDEILPYLDGEIVRQLVSAMKNLGIEFRQGQKWGAITRTKTGVQTTFGDGSTLDTEQLLFAAGRVGNTTDLGLENVDVKPDSRGYLPVDRRFRTSADSVMAAGDVVGFPALASVSMEQGRVAVCHAFGFGYKESVSELMPYGIYTIPEVSTIGETEETCQKKGIDYVAGRAFYKHNARGKITGDVEGITKLVIDAKTRRVLGVHVIGERATELVHIGQTLLHLGGTVDLFIDMVFNHPTLSESYKYAAYDCLGALAKRAE